jgi:hypothetical protein
MIQYNPIKRTVVLFGDGCNQNEVSIW